MKKAFGILFFVLFGLSILGMVLDGSLNYYLSYSLPIMLGTIFGWAFYIGAGIFFFVLDASDRKPIHTAIETRKTLMIWAIVLTAISAIICFMTVRTSAGNMAVLNVDLYFELTTLDIILGVLKASWVSIASFLIFVGSFIMWFWPFLRVRDALKGFKVEDLAYMSFEPLGYSKNVYVNPHAILFRNQLIIIPINQIAAIKERVVLVEHDIVFTFTNGKKMEVVSSEFPAINDYLARVQRVGQ